MCILGESHSHSHHYSHSRQKITIRDPRPRGYFHIRRSGGVDPKFASEILVGAPNFASKNISDKYPKFCTLNFRYDPKIGTFSQLLRLVVTELPKSSKFQTPNMYIITPVIKVNEFPLGGSGLPKDVVISR